MTTTQLYSLYLKSDGVSIDTRTLIAGEIFFAIKGDNFNGNFYAAKAISQGALLAIVDEEKYCVDERYVLVEDVLNTLQKLANYHRRQLKATVIGLTGSNGKTTTKELIYAVLAQKYQVYATKGNLNNHLGVPLSLLRAGVEHDYVIIEMGANHQGEIELLSSIAEPDFGIITNIGKAHLEGFGGIEGVKKGKSELYNYIKNNRKSIIYNQDDPVIVDLLGGYTPAVAYSKSMFKKIENVNFISFAIDDHIIHTKLIGDFQLNNLAVAWVVGLLFEVETRLITKALESYIPDNNRSQIYRSDTNTFILDAYNANPSSMNASIDAFINANYSNKMIIVGDMLELGEYTKEEHWAIINKLSRYPKIRISYVGKIFSELLKDTDYRFFKSTGELKEWFQQQNIKECHILLKGSRGVALEKLIK